MYEVADYYLWTHLWHLNDGLRCSWGFPSRADVNRDRARGQADYMNHNWLVWLGQKKITGCFTVTPTPPITYRFLMLLINPTRLYLLHCKYGRVQCWTARDLDGK